MFDVFNPLENVEILLTPEQLDDIIHWFDENAKPLLFVDEVPFNIITINELQKFLELKKYHKRNFNYPSYGEIMTEAENLQAGVTKMLTKEQVIYMLNKRVIEPNLKHELRLAFKIFDTEKRNFLEMEELQTIVTSYGDVFSKPEVQEMLRDANVRGDGNIFYEEFIESLFNVAPELNKLKAEYLYDDPNEDPSVPPDVVKEEPKPTHRKSHHHPAPTHPAPPADTAEAPATT